MPHNYSLKSVKTFEGREGIGFSADLYEGNKKVASVLEDASGGDLRLCFLEAAAEKRLHEIAKSMPRFIDARYSDPQNPDQPLSWQPDADHVVNELFDEYMREKEEQKIKRQCQKKTLYELYSDGKDHYRILNTPFSPKLGEALRQKYGSDLKAIINERFLSLTGCPNLNLSAAAQQRLLARFLEECETIHSGRAETVWAIINACHKQNIPYRVEAIYATGIEEPTAVRVSNPERKEAWPDGPGRTVIWLEEFIPEAQDAPEEDNDCGPRM